MSAFLFVDRILQLSDEGQCRGIARITADHPYLYQTITGEYVLMDAIVGESLGQLGAWWVMRALNFTKRPVAGIVPNVEICGQAKLGDTVLLETTIDECDDERVMYHAVATVNDQPIFYIHEALGPMLAMADLIDESVVKQQFQQLYRPGEFQSTSALEFEQCLTTQANNPYPVSFDRIIDWQPAVSAVAQKQISNLAPYFVDHFPHKPVLPLTLLLQCKLDLATRFLHDMLGEARAQQFKPRFIKRTKMNEFVQPGDELRCKLSVKNISDDEYHFTFRSEVNGQRVCVAQAEFIRQ